MMLDGRTGSFRNAIGASLHKRAELELTTRAGFAFRVGTAEQAEVTIVIRSDFRNRGISWRLLNHVSEHAAMRGVKTLRTILSRDNCSAIRLEREMGFVARPVDGDMSRIVLEKSLAAPECGLAA